MKTCTDCKKVKPYTEFNAVSRYKDGYDIRCCSCRRIKYLVGTPDLLLKQIYRSQSGSSIQRGHPPPSYSINDLITWVNAQTVFPNLWEAFVASNYSKNMLPSIDRLDDSKPYTLDNIQIITWKENDVKGIKSRSKAVAAYNVDGTLYKTFASACEAARHVKAGQGDISAVANGTPVKRSNGRTFLPRSCKGFIWKWV